MSYDVKLLPTFFIVGPRDDNIRKMFAFDGWVRESVQENADLIVFQGGADINPMLYGQRMHPTTHTSFRRDLEDIEALRKWKGPWEQTLVGICRGAQFLNVMVGGGSLWQNVNNHTRSHQMVINGLEPAIIACTSTHHQQMRIGHNATVLAYAKESTLKQDDKGDYNPDWSKPGEDVEVVAYYDRATLCFQGHPEYDMPNNRAFRNYFLETVRKEVIGERRREEVFAAMDKRAAELRHRATL